MAGEPMTPERLAAGADYLRALEQRGVRPEGMFWTQEQGSDDFSLVIVSTLVDRVGPQEIYDTLFKAYDAAVTPRSIDPWLVTIFSPHTTFVQQLRQSMNMVSGDIKLFDDEGHELQNLGYVTYRALKFVVQADWIYVTLASKPPSIYQMRNWERFTREVERAAA